MVAQVVFLFNSFSRQIIWRLHVILAVQGAWRRMEKRLIHTLKIPSAAFGLFSELGLSGKGFAIAMVFFPHLPITRLISVDLFRCFSVCNVFWIDNLTYV